MTPDPSVRYALVEVHVDPKHPSECDNKCRYMGDGQCWITGFPEDRFTHKRTATCNRLCRKGAKLMAAIAKEGE